MWRKNNWKKDGTVGVDHKSTWSLSVQNYGDNKYKKSNYRNVTSYCKIIFLLHVKTFNDAIAQCWKIVLAIWALGKGSKHVLLPVTTSWTNPLNHFVCFVFLFTSNSCNISLPTNFVFLLLLLRLMLHGWKLDGPATHWSRVVDAALDGPGIHLSSVIVVCKMKHWIS